MFELNTNLCLQISNKIKIKNQDVFLNFSQGVFYTSLFTIEGRVKDEQVI